MSCPACVGIRDKKLVKAEDIHMLDGKIYCLHCGCQAYPYPNRWDSYFHKVCKAIASKSPCLSRNIGAILVRDNSIISTGYNGPARGVPHCTGNECPRHSKGSMSGDNLLECSAVHAEANCVANAARIGASTIGTTLYMNCIIPCKDCSSLLINAGVTEIVVDDLEYYHNESRPILEAGNIIVRKFNIVEEEDEEI